MISKEEIKKLAELARIEVGEKETETLRGDMDSILGYLDQVKSIQELENNGEGSVLNPITPQNVMREDENPTESETYSKDLIAEFPDKQGNYLKVKKIL